MDSKFVPTVKGAPWTVRSCDGLVLRKRDTGVDTRIVPNHSPALRMSNCQVKCAQFVARSSVPGLLLRLHAVRVSAPHAHFWPPSPV